MAVRRLDRTVNAEAHTLHPNDTHATEAPMRNPYKGIWEAGELTSRFGLEETEEKNSFAQALVAQCRTTFVTGLVFDSFRRATDKSDLRNRLAKVLTTFENKWDKKALHPTVLARVDLAWRFGVAV